MWAYSKKLEENSDSRMRGAKLGEARRALALLLSSQAEGEISGLKQALDLLVGSTLPSFEVGQRSFANELQHPHLSIDNLRLRDPSRAAADDLEAKRSYP